jgi:hypothetical protein
MKIATMKFPAEVGFLVRDAFKREFRNACFMKNIKINKFEEDRGCLSSGFRIEIEGELNKLLIIKKWLEEIQQ